MVFAIRFSTYNSYDERLDNGFTSANSHLLINPKMRRGVEEVVVEKNVDD